MTDKQTEALKLALEAQIHKAGMNPIMQGECFVMHPEALHKVIEVAIREALAEQPAQQQELVAFGEVLRGRVCGYTPGMSRVELQLPESTLIGGWLELGETVYIASVLGFNQHTTEAKLKEKNA